MDQEILILVVDDDPDILFATARIVQKQGYGVIKAASGEECLKKAKANKPDLILLDVVLPDANGTDLCKQIKADPFFQGTFVILLSSMKTTSAEQAQGLDVGADGYIARPLSNKELAARVNAMVRILKTERQRDDAIAQLEEAMGQIKRLSGLLPICMYCKKIRDETGYWNQLEDYIHKHSEADFSHSICQACAKEHYPDMDYPES